MKRITILLLTVILLFTLGACGDSQTGGESSAGSGSVQQNDGKETASQYSFECTEDEPEVIENLIFNEDVTVSGEKGQITFVNCEFKGDVTLTANEGTRVILEKSQIDGQCKFQNDTKEATMEWSFPKFLVDIPVDVVCDDCIGAVIPLGDFEIVFNGETYSMDKSELFFDLSDPDAGFVPYTGQQANYYSVVQWWENGEKKVLVECEYDPNM